jgi:uncharacterized protein YjlB
MTVALKRSTPNIHMFADDGSIPNNPALPLVLYRNAIDLGGASSPEAAIEQKFAANGWGKMWCNGIYPFVHYHSMIHEALGIARGRATVRFGGDNGQEIEVAAGDVAILPAGTGHQRLKQSGDLVVIGAYPPTGTYNLCRGSEAEHAKALTTIPNVPPPATDPLFGADGPLVSLWRA